jgi:hypothetical protein
MAHPDGPSETISDVIDEVERIREDLFRLQRELEKMESLQKVVSTDDRKEASRPVGLLPIFSSPSN